jgi:hypothetical protein
MVEISDEAWLALTDLLENLDAGDEIWWSNLEDHKEGLGEVEISLMLERAAEMGMIRQTDQDTWERRYPDIDGSPREEE